MLNKEDRLIRLLSFGEIDAPRRDEIIRIAGQGLDWDYIVESASREGVSSFIFDRISSSGLKDIVPVPFFYCLRSVYYTYSAQNLLLFNELSSVLSALNGQRIPTILLKGSVLAERVYGNIALRPLRDMDILVRRHDVTGAVSALEALGYSPIASVKDQLDDPFSYSVTLSKQGIGMNTGASIDLHWHILNASWLMGLCSKKCDIERLWSLAEYGNISGVRSCVLSRAHFLISLAVNAFTHSYHRLILLVDIDKALGFYKGTIAMDSLFLEAGRCGLEDILDITLNDILLSEHSGKTRGHIAGHVFKREYRSFRPCLMYILACRSTVKRFKAVFGIIRVAILIFIFRLKPKKS